MQRRCCCPPERPSALFFSRSLTSSHRAACCSAALHPLVHVRPEPEVAGRPRPRCRRSTSGTDWALEHHPDPAANLDAVDARSVHVVAVVEDLAGDPEAGDRVVHAVETADERGLAAAGRTDHRCDEVPVDPERRAHQRPAAAVVRRHVLDVEHRRAYRIDVVAVEPARRQRLGADPYAARHRVLAVRAASWGVHGRHAPPIFARLRASSRRARTFIARMRTSSTNAAPHRRTSASGIARS